MTSMTRYSPNTGISRLQREVDDLFDALATSFDGAGQRTGSMWSPAMDLSETEESFRILLDLPGIRREDVEITYEDGTLKISGERRSEQHEKNGRFHRAERWQGRYFRALTLGPNVDPDGISASFEDGVLNIAVPKPEQVKPRRIEIR
jgi:HSP20 family protein